MRKVLLICIMSTFLLGCTSYKSNEIKPTSIFDPTPKNSENFIDELEKLNNSNKTNTTSKEIPFECKDIEYEVFILINEIRKDNHLKELKWDEKMYKHIITRTDEITENFSHTRPNGSSCFTIYDKLNGENIAKGYPNAQSVVDGWMNSKGHKDNILKKDFTKTAIGYKKINSGTYWCQGFGY